MSTLTIRDVRARAVTAPLVRPLRTASGSIEVSPLILLDVLTEQGITGQSYLFGYTPLTLKPLMSLIEQVKPELIGKAVVPVERMRPADGPATVCGIAVETDEVAAQIVLWGRPFSIG